MNNEFRVTYAEAAKKSDKLRVLEQLISQAKEESSTLEAYRGAVSALKGNYAFFPTSKLSYFWEASKHFEKAISQDLEDLEAVFLRFTVECGVPSIMSYALHLEADRKKVIALLPTSKVEDDFKIAIATYLLESERCTEQETIILNTYL